MELMTKQGYKQTEVGLIPEDWDIEPIIGLASISTGGSDTQDRVDDGAYPFFVRSQTIERINKFSFNGEAILTSGDGVGVGKIFHYVNCKFDYHQRVYNIHNYRNDVAGKYLFFQFSTHFYDRVMAMTAKSSVDSVRREMIADMLIPIPPTLTEQKAIATALSDVDALITSLEQTITKKKAIKQGAMQQLLTPPHKGGKRLPGFSGEWVEKTLGELAEIATGTTPPTRDLENYGSEYCFVSPADLGKGKYINETIKNLSAKGFALSRIFPTDSIMVTCIGSTIGKIGIATKTLTSNQQINAIFPNDNFISEYIYYQLSLNALKIKQMASEQAVPMINKTEFSEFVVSFPTLKEQKAIAQILSDMDAEITQLETKKEKYQAIKQGMMQELLTGKTRLI